MGDVCYILRKLLGKKPKNQIYNLSRGKSLSLKAIANKVQVAYQEHYNELLPIHLNNEDKTPHSTTLSVDMSKLKKAN